MSMPPQPPALTSGLRNFIVPVARTESSLSSLSNESKELHSTEDEQFLLHHSSNASDVAIKVFVSETTTGSSEEDNSRRKKTSNRSNDSVSSLSNEKPQDSDDSYSIEEGKQMQMQLVRKNKRQQQQQHSTEHSSSQDHSSKKLKRPRYEDLPPLKDDLTTPEGQRALNPSLTLEQATLEAKREYNRRNAARARKRSKNLMGTLQKTVYDLNQEIRSIRTSNEKLTKLVATLTDRNSELVRNTRILNELIRSLDNNTQQQVSDQSSTSSPPALPSVASLPQSRAAPPSRVPPLAAPQPIYPPRISPPMPRQQTASISSSSSSSSSSQQPPPQQLAQLMAGMLTWLLQQQQQQQQPPQGSSDLLTLLSNAFKDN